MNHSKYNFTNSFILACAIIALLMLLTGCTNKIEQLQQTTNSDYEVCKLFTTQDGITIYRFYDPIAGEPNYFYFSNYGVIKQTIGAASHEQQHKDSPESNPSLMATTLCPHCNKNIDIIIK